MKRLLDEGPSSGPGPGKEGLYARATPMSPPHHLLGSNISSGTQSMMANVQSVLHLTTNHPSQSGGNPATNLLSGQPSNVPQHSTPPIHPAGAVQNYTKDGANPALATVQYQYSALSLPAKNSTVHNIQGQPHGGQPLHLRHKVHPGGNVSAQGSGTPPGGTSQTNFQKLKVEDALSYLDQVKLKFGSEPQVYNDFLDIMKEFKSQSIDTPGVIQRVSNLFKGHPELIVGFNTFLPPGYKIEVQSNEQGFAFQVSVSMPSPTAATTTLIQTSHHSLPTGGQNEMIPLLQSVSKHNSNNLNSHSGRGTPPQQANAHYPHQQGSGTNNILRGPSPAPGPSHISITPQQAHLAVSHALSNVDAAHPTPQSQPVEFNHAINYVNKIKNRFQGQPDKYKRFLEILHTYQKEQKNIKEGTSGPGKHLTEAEVYSQVSKLFEHQEDLLAEFGQFLPDATSHLNSRNVSGQEHQNIVKKSANMKSSNYSMNVSRDSNYVQTGPDRETSRGPLVGSGSLNKQSHSQLKRSSSFSTSGIQKKHKIASWRDVTLADAAKYASLSDYGFFDKVRKSLKNQEVYENFLRCLTLFNEEIISKSELVQLITPFLGRFPEQLRWFKDFVGFSESAGIQNAVNHNINVEHVPNNLRQDRPTGDLAMEIDYSTCKRLGASYCALPKSYVQPKCSGRTILCKEVLNDTWVSFPSWSEDSTFVTSRKTQYEEYIYRCEDERFELDVVIETNGATVRVLEAVQKKISRMSPEEAQKFRLDDTLGGTSPTIHVRALKRVYGDKASDMLDGLKKNPLVAIPVVLRRLRAKEEEWREAQKGFNKLWREQNEKYYLKSLDHQGMNFKQTDLKALRSKGLFNEIETLFDERHEQNEENNLDSGQIIMGPHLILQYKDKSILDDAANLLIHHVKRLSGIQKDDKHKMKLILRHFIPDLFHHTRQDLSDDEKDSFDDKDEMDVDAPVQNDKSSDQISTNNNEKKSSIIIGRGEEKIKSNLTVCNGGPVAKSDMGPNPGLLTMKKEPDDQTDVQNGTSLHPDECYSLFMANNNWYLFLRLHHILCDRLTKMYERACILSEEEAKYKLDRKESTSLALRLKPRSEIEVEDYYPAFLEMIKNVLDGNMDSNAYEDTLREMFGIHAYIAFTMDKVVTYAVRQLQHIVCDEAPQECLDIFHQELKRGGAGGSCSTAHQRIHAEMAYQKRLEQILADENCFKIFVYKIECKITFELLDNDLEEPEPANESEKWANYVNNYASSIRNNPDDDENILELNDLPRSEKPVFLPRNARSWRKLYAKQKLGTKQEGDAEEKDADKSNDKSDDGIKREKSPPSRIGVPEVESCISAYDNSECRFNLNSYKILFVINKENLLYKKNAFSKAKKSHPWLTKTKNKKFKEWNDRWVECNVADHELKTCTDWLMGRGCDVVPNRTKILTDNDLTKPPYVPYNRYKVERLE
ncbi:hypothetical protein RUM44_006564 [Polyplax serrata]|uniref:Histone deacetylase interacting domain-containing protein n=1 Tax=Polyplax serrata TaxID=468196 RepID=A0ABR1AII4_POLSC